jgi:exodeoxyribonuclease-3
MRIATWNVNSLRVRLPQLLSWLEDRKPDLVALQETKLPDEAFPGAQIEAAGYQFVRSGQKTYNGVAILAREPLHAAVSAIPGFEDPQRRVLAATWGGIRIVNLYVPNGQTPQSEKYAYKLRWLGALQHWLASELAAHPRLIALGDFNIAPEDRDVHDPAAWVGSVLVSEPERAALRTVLQLGMVDVFRQFEQPPQTYSWWDYRAGSFRRNAGLRIDLILGSAPLAAQCTACEVDRAARGAERASDHAPVLATFDI